MHKSLDEYSQVSDIHLFHLLRETHGYIAFTLALTKTPNLQYG
jgi:hypothetical protein